YEDIGAIASDDHFLVNRSLATYLGTYGKDLFNGNISHMITTIPTTANPDADHPDPQLGAYTYDQLNRIKRARFYHSSNFSIATASDNDLTNGSAYDGRYQERYWYDQNGNITQLKRNSSSGTLMDDFEYNYYNNTTTSRYYGNRNPEVYCAIHRIPIWVP
ncbi:MAG TPA: hypothetical protein VD905_19370, partial [Flavobacteriales bacterium]|nr:hypothetical protein [Flavobacteriales bacterium]